jgi:hypothetical protein
VCGKIVHRGRAGNNNGKAVTGPCKKKKRVNTKKSWQQWWKSIALPEKKKSTKTNLKSQYPRNTKSVA